MQTNYFSGELPLADLHTCPIISGAVTILLYVHRNKETIDFPAGCARPGLDAPQLLFAERFCTIVRVDRLRLVAAGRRIVGLYRLAGTLVAVFRLAAGRDLAGDVAADHGRC